MERDRDAKGRWLKGKRGGPGRQKLAIPLSDEIRLALAESSQSYPDLTNRQALIKVLIGLGLQGNIASIQLLFDRGYGKAADVIQIEKGEDVDLSLLTTEELAIYFSLLEKVTSGESDFIQ